MFQFAETVVLRIHLEQRSVVVVVVKIFVQNGENYKNSAVYFDGPVV